MSLSVEMSWQVNHRFEVNPQALIEAFPQEWEDTAEEPEKDRFRVFLNGFIESEPAEIFGSLPGVNLLWEEDDDVDFRWSPERAQELAVALERARLENLPPPQNTSLLTITEEDA